jgi:catechol 2,3-dioxygenase-like lactoylglutathione lyase family enzyme
VKFPSLDHVGYTVADLDRSSDFYTLLLGEEPFLRKVWDVDYVSEIVGYPQTTMDCAFWYLPNKAAVLELVQYLTPAGAVVDMETYNAGNAHLCLVTEDMDADYDRLRGHVEFRSEAPIEIPWGPYKGGRVCYLRDPDGITIELMEHPPGGPSFEE